MMDKGSALVSSTEAASMSAVPPRVSDSKVRPIKRFTIEHRRCVALYVQGKSHVEIAAIMDRKPAWVSAVLTNPTTRALMSRVYERAEQRLQDLMPVAVEVIREGLLAPDHNTRFKALDRYHKAVELTGSKGETTAEDVIERVIKVRHGDTEVTVGERRA